MYYPAALIPYRDGSGQYGVVFPDLPGCVSVGNNIEHAIVMAQEALSLHLSGMMEDGDILPVSSTTDLAREKMQAEALEDKEPLPDGVVYQYIVADDARPPAKKKPSVNLSISLKPSILAHIDAMAEEMGLTRSGLIAVAARDYVSRMKEICFNPQPAPSADRLRPGGQQEPGGLPPP
jgi:predicted RNase H-like HicB family nuclease